MEYWVLATLIVDIAEPLFVDKVIAFARPALEGVTEWAMAHPTFLNNSQIM